MDPSPPPRAEPPERRGAELLRIGRDLAGLLALVLLGWAIFGWFRAPELPEQAPAVTTTALSGAPIDLAALRGRVVVLNFWATWCGPCQLEMPELRRFAEANPDVPVLFLAVDGKPAELAAFARQMGLPVDRVARLDEATQAAYGVRTLPTTVVVGADGAVRTAFTGMVARPWLWAWTRTGAAGG